MRFDAMGAGAARAPTATSAAAGWSAPRATTSASPRCCAAAASSTACASSRPRTVDYMASNHLPGGADLTEFGRPLFAETTFDGVGFGLGVSVTIDPVKAKVPGSVGEFGWGGAASTAFWVDPVEDLTVVFMTQLLPSSTPPHPQPAAATRPRRHHRDIARSTRSCDALATGACST